MAVYPRLIYGTDKGFIIGGINAANRHRRVVRGIYEGNIPTINFLAIDILHCGAVVPGQCHVNPLIRIGGDAPITPPQTRTTFGTIGSKQEIAGWVGLPVPLDIGPGIPAQTFTDDALLFDTMVLALPVDPGCQRHGIILGRGIEGADHNSFAGCVETHGRAIVAGHPLYFTIKRSIIAVSRNVGGLGPLAFMERPIANQIRLNCICGDA